MTEIHPTAIVDKGFQAGKGVRIGPFCIVGPDVVLGDNVELRSNVIVTGRTTIGANTVVFPFATIGEAPQDMGYRDEPTELVIGEKCTIHEYATLHRGTVKGRGRTVVGNNCFLMVSAHVAHDCIVGNNVVLTNCATLGGHVEVGDYAILGGLSAVQQRTRIGAHSFIGGLTAVTTDLIPFGMAVGKRGELAGLNLVGMKRRGFDRASIHALRGAYRVVFFGTGTREERLAEAERQFPNVAVVKMLADFIRASGNNPLCLPREDDEDDA
jgi:UDP-N-acetylglucosamine acyltransferase